MLTPDELTFVGEIQTELVDAFMSLGARESWAKYGIEAEFVACFPGALELAVVACVFRVVPVRARYLHAERPGEPGLCGYAYAIGLTRTRQIHDARAIVGLNWQELDERVASRTARWAPGDWGVNWLDGRSPSVVVGEAAQS